MKVLCLNTAFSQTYVAVENNSAIETKTMDSSLKQSENVLGVVDECLCRAKIDISDLNFIACVIGPGSFTGIRIGASLAKGFCMAVPHIKKIAINSLDLLAYIFAKNYKPNKEFYVVLNGLSGNIFACKYASDGKSLQPASLLFGQEICLLCGTIVGLKEENLDICNNFVDFSSDTLLEYAKEQIQFGNFVEDFVPLYLRKSQAEAELDKKNEN